MVTKHCMPFAQCPQISYRGFVAWWRTEIFGLQSSAGFNDQTTGQEINWLSIREIDRRDCPQLLVQYGMTATDTRSGRMGFCHSCVTRVDQWRTPSGQLVKQQAALKADFPEHADPIRRRRENRPPSSWIGSPPTYRVGEATDCFLTSPEGPKPKTVSRNSIHTRRGSDPVGVLGSWPPYFRPSVGSKCARIPNFLVPCCYTCPVIQWGRWKCWTWKWRTWNWRTNVHGMKLQDMKMQEWNSRTQKSTQAANVWGI